MSKFVVNNYSGRPTLQCGQSTSTFDRDGITTVCESGTLTDGKVLFPVRGTVKQYDDGRITVNGQFIDWNAIVAESNRPQIKLPGEMLDEPAVRSGEKACVVCKERSIKTAIVDCGHQIYCVTCARTCVKQDTTCPVCRTRISNVIRLYEA